MPNSTTTIQSIIDYARTMPDLEPVLAQGGFSQQPALTIANDTLMAMLAPGMNWKWNRFLLPQFYTNSWQQDYALNVANVGWLEHGFVVDINNTAQPPPVWILEIVRDLERTSFQTGRIGQVSWLPNDQLQYARWTANATYNQILGTPSNPGTPVSQIIDANGNYWAVANNLNQTVTTGSTQPTWPTLVQYPTYANPALVPTFVLDGSVVWMAINPKGQGIRVNPIPPQSGLYFQVNLIGQMRPTLFTSVTQVIEPVPDDMAGYFRQGFIAHAYRHSRQPEARAKFQVEFNLWQASLRQALASAAREKEEVGFYPSENLMNNGYPIYLGPANPWYPGGF